MTHEALPFCSNRDTILYDPIEAAPLLQPAPTRFNGGKMDVEGGTGICYTLST
jgi:hypothetical protein